MRIKTYFASSVEAAISLASRELGGEALLLSARSAGIASQHLGEYEVVFGMAEAGVEAAPASRSLESFLQGQDFHPSLVEDTLRILSGRESTDAEVAAAIIERIRLKTEDAFGEPGSRVFVGPTGSGKTTSLMKVALQAPPELPVTIIDTDIRKIGSGLGRAAALAGIGYVFAQGPEGVARIAGSLPGHLLLIDTPGFTPSDGEWIARWKNALGGLGATLVLSATARTADLMLTLERYRMFTPQDLIFTRLDEAACAGGFLSAASISGLPLAGFGMGPRAVDPLEAPGKGRIVEVLYGPGKPMASAAGGTR